MLFYLDNNMSAKGPINENYGRELLELFSLGVGMDGHPNYTEEDVKECARGFTGWTRGNPIPKYPYSRHDYEVRFYETHEIAVSSGQALAIDATGAEFEASRGNQIWTGCVKDPCQARILGKPFPAG